LGNVSSPPVDIPQVCFFLIKNIYEIVDCRTVVVDVVVVDVVDVFVVDVFVVVVVAVVVVVVVVVVVDVVVVGPDCNYSNYNLIEVANP